MFSHTIQHTYVCVLSQFRASLFSHSRSNNKNHFRLHIERTMVAKSNEWLETRHHHRKWLNALPLHHSVHILSSRNVFYSMFIDVCMENTSSRWWTNRLPLSFFFAPVKRIRRTYTQHVSFTIKVCVILIAHQQHIGRFTLIYMLHKQGTSTHRALSGRVYLDASFVFNLRQLMIFLSSSVCSLSYNKIWCSLEECYIWIGMSSCGIFLWGFPQYQTVDMWQSSPPIHLLRHTVPLWQQRTNKKLNKKKYRNICNYQCLYNLNFQAILYKAKSLSVIFF